jgi:hypothetical protein
MRMVVLNPDLFEISSSIIHYWYRVEIGGGAKYEPGQAFVSVSVASLSFR